MVLSHLPYEEVRIKEEKDFATSYDITLSMAEAGNRETGVKVMTTIGPYPVLLIGLAQEQGLERAKEIMFGGMEMAQKLVKEGRAIGIGEIGRPHFAVDPEIWEASNEIMEFGMKLAAEAGCAVVLHTEGATPAVMEDLARRADASGLPRERVVKHYSPPLVKAEENFGLFPSVLASRPALKEALSKGVRFLMETDFLDDPSRPGAVMAITTVPKRTKALLQSGEMTEENARIVHQENAKTVYGIEIK